MDPEYSDPEPTLEAAPLPLIELPGGFIDDDGAVYRMAEIRELNGYDEEALDAVFKTAKVNPFERYVELLKRAVLRIGNVETIDREVIMSLLLGDRDFLVMAIRQATYGNILEGQTNCSVCGTDNDVVLDLSEDVEVRRLEYLKAIHTVELRNDRVAEVRLSNVGDQYALGEVLTTSSLAELNTLLLSRIVISVDGRDILDGAAEPLEFARAMTSADRLAILTFLEDTQPGPRLEEVRVPCASCGADIDTPIALDRLLR